MRVQVSLWGIRCVWLRYFDVFRKSFIYYLVTTFLEPILYLLSFGIGLGSLVEHLEYHGIVVKYRSFIFSGIIGQAVLFQGFFEASYGGFVRMYYQKIFHAMAVTPITLSEVLWGELLWDTMKATTAAEVVVFIGVMTGDFSPWSMLQIFPLCFASSLLFSALGLAVAANSSTIDQISYPQFLLVFPMFLFSGVFYPIENLPIILQGVAWALPLTSVISLARSFTLGFPIEIKAIFILFFWLIILVWISRKSMTRRLVK